MLIVLDTTETFADPRLEGPDFRFLSSYVARHPVKLFVPTIVVQETFNHFRETFGAAVAGLRSAVRGVAKLAPEVEQHVQATIDSEGILAAYKTHLDQRLRALLAAVPTYERVRMEAVVERALKRRKPFDAEGKRGFRDALLWETVIDILREHGKPLVLITRNRKDFGEHGTLAQDLKDDLKSVGLGDLDVSICDGLARFVQGHVKPELERLDEIQRLINEGQFEAFRADTFFEENVDSIMDELAEHVRRIDLDRVARGCSGRFDSPRLGPMAGVTEEFEAVDVWQIDSHQISIGIDYLVSGSIACRQEIQDYPEDNYWHEDFEGKVSFKLLMSVVVNLVTKEPVSWEISDIEVTLGHRWPFPDYG